jgi:hypothetical protein
MSGLTLLSVAPEEYQSTTTARNYVLLQVSEAAIDPDRRCFSDAIDAFLALGHRLELAMTLQAWGALPDGAAAKAEAEELLSSLHP